MQKRGWVNVDRYYFKGIVHPKMKFLSIWDFILFSWSLRRLLGVYTCPRTTACMCSLLILLHQPAPARAGMFMCVLIVLSKQIKSFAILVMVTDSYFQCACKFRNYLLKLRKTIISSFYCLCLYTNTQNSLFQSCLNVFYYNIRV